MRLKAPSSARRPAGRPSSAAAASAIFAQFRTAEAMAAAFSLGGIEALSSACDTTARTLSASMASAPAKSASMRASQRSRTSRHSKYSEKCRASSTRSWSTSAQPYRNCSIANSPSWLKPAGIVTQGLAPAPGQRSAALKKWPSSEPARTKRCAATSTPPSRRSAQSAKRPAASAPPRGAHRPTSSKPPNTASRACNSSAGSSARTAARAACGPSGEDIAASAGAASSSQ
mmetsp:Transcript_34482/g.98002  ORF Transcript_34482/g.98002 Transcript_34482/m.98002 type:complete len:230 (+) Transcript_34482:551-1240(+)